MNWFRKNLKLGSRLALLALALQFVLSFGHFHVDVAQAGSSTLAGHVRDLGQNPAQELTVSAADERSVPASHDDSQPSTEPCAICAVMSTASQLVLATQVPLPIPDFLEFRVLSPGKEFAGPTKALLAFQSRAPPAS